MSNQKSNKKLIVGTLAALLAGAGLYFYFSPSQAPAPTKSISKTATAPKTAPVTRTKRTSKKIPVYPKTIKGKIITLKLLSNAFAFAYHQAFTPNARKGLEWPEKMTFSEVAYNVSYSVNKMKKGLTVAYTIWDNKDDKLIGAIQVREYNEKDPGQMSMWLNENYRGGGRIQEAMYLISKEYFRAHPEHKNYIVHVRKWNAPSARSMEKFGFKETGEYPDDGKGARRIFELTPEIIKEKSKLYE